MERGRREGRSVERLRVYDLSGDANRLLTRAYRAPFVVSEKV